MIRNREILFLALGYALLAVLGAALIFPSSLWAGWVFVAVMAALGILMGVFLFWRYRRLEEMAAMVRAVAQGDALAPLHSNFEGELSILRSEISKLAHTLTTQNQRLEHEKNSLMNSLSDISHQLKTPLTSIAVMADLLKNPDLPEEKRKQFARRLQTQTERMEWLVTSILKLSRLDAGVVEFKSERLPARRFIDKALEPLLIPMDLKNQRLTLSGEDSAMLSADARWTVEALLNVLKNCMEHTPEGGEIQIRYAETALFTEIAIQDSGEGIDKEDLPHIFKRFYRGKNASEDSVGIGLAMSYAIVNAQNGSLSVTSRSGEGSRFTFRFMKNVV